MKEATIEELVYELRVAEKNKEPQPIFFLGAGASRSGGIPLAGEIIQQILTNYADSPRVCKLSENEQTYKKLMEAIGPKRRDELLKKYIDAAKINVTHIYLAQLLHKGFVDYVLTVNFDNLMLRALALFNIFPSTYDMAILKDLTTSTFKEKSVVYLHGQHHGLWLLNTSDEMAKVNETVPSIFNSITTDRPWVFIGYSGDDPIFEHVKKLGRFDNGLYWVTYKDHDPGPKVKEFLSNPDTNAFLVKGYDSDSFMLKLNSALGLPEPEIIVKPFSVLKEMLNEVVDIEEKEHLKGIKERLSIAKRQVDDAIQFSKEESTQHQLDALKMKIINILISREYDYKEITNILKSAEGSTDESLIMLLSSLYNNWGLDLNEKAERQIEQEAETLYFQAIEKFERALTIQGGLHEVIFNWGNSLGGLADLKSGNEAEVLYLQAIEKYEQALAISPNDYGPYYNCGTIFGKLASLKSEGEAEALYEKSFEKYEHALAIETNQHELFFNWGIFLGEFATKKVGIDSEKLYQQACEKYEMALKIQPDIYKAFFNWGNNLVSLAALKSRGEAELLYEQAFEKYERAITIKPDNYEAFYNWGTYLADLATLKTDKKSEVLYEQAFEKFEQSLIIKPDLHEAFNNWGNGLANLAALKSASEAEGLYREAFEKYERALAIKPDKYETFGNWGSDLGKLAAIKSGNEAEELYEQAFEKFEQCLAIKPDVDAVLNIWGGCLANLAALKSGNEAEALYLRAIEKYEHALAIKPDKFEAFDNLGTSLGKLAALKTGKEAEELYLQAIEKHQRAIDLGGGAYNLACVYALMQEKENSLLHLDESLSKHQIALEFVEKDDDWNGFRDDPDFIALLNKHR